MDKLTILGAVIAYFIMGGVVLGVASAFDEDIINSGNEGMVFAIVTFWPAVVIFLVALVGYFVAKRATLRIRSYFK